MSSETQNEFPVGVHTLGNDPEQPKETLEYRLNHLMLRISNPAKSLAFYKTAFGMRTIFTFNTGAFTIYYLGHTPDASAVPAPNPHISTLGTQKGLLELYHVHAHPSDKPYHSGNSEPWGFGHVGFTVPNVQEAIDRIVRICPETEVIKPLGESRVGTMGVEGVKEESEVDEGYKKVFEQLAFVKDPDGYWVELVPQVVKS